jgi:7-cyano-7-deazaguanine tRNA-ribosyltransferase
MESYEFRLLAMMIISAKRSIPSSKPLHLFGAGHPLTIPLAVALGCDTFDSASYMLYARDNRYMLPTGTARLDDLEYLPCSCEVCMKYKAAELLGLEEDRRFQELAVHNLNVIKTEVDAVKQAIMDGRLWEYVVQKAMSHPRLYEAMEVLKENVDYLEEGTPVSKDKAIFLFSQLDQYRPEVRRFRKIVSNTKSRKSILLLLPEPDQHPFYTQYTELRKLLDEDIQLAYYSPFLAIVPEEISDLFPAAHHVYARCKFNPDDFETFGEALRSYIRDNGFKEVVAVADDFLQGCLKRMPELEITLLPFHSLADEIASALKRKKEKSDA